MAEPIIILLTKRLVGLAIWLSVLVSPLIGLWLIVTGFKDHAMGPKPGKSPTAQIIFGFILTVAPMLVAGFIAFMTRGISLNWNSLLR